MQGFDLLAPIAGTIIDFNLTMGESLLAGEEAYAIANLDSVWVDLRIYQRNLPQIAVGQRATLSIANDAPSVVGEIGYIGPRIDRKTRTGLARVLIENPDLQLRPGQFITGEIVLEEIEAPIVVPLSAIHSVDGARVVYVRSHDGDAFESRAVELGHRDGEYVQINHGLDVGDFYVSEGGFFLKADSQKDNFGDGHAH